MTAAPPTLDEIRAAVAEYWPAWKRYQRVAADLQAACARRDVTAARALEREANALVQTLKRCARVVVDGATAYGLEGAVEGAEMFAELRRTMAGNPLWEPKNRS